MGISKRNKSRKQEWNFLGHTRFIPHVACCVFFLTHALAKKMPDKAFWTPGYQGAPEELKPCLSGTDIFLVLIIMEVTL